MISKAVNVAVGVVFDSDRKVLLAKRASNAHLGDLWEFPGGKVESGELSVDALIRELREEIGIEVINARSLIKVRHRYPDKFVLLDVMIVESYTGVPTGKEGQPLIWIAPDDLFDLDNLPIVLPDANKAIVKALRVPDAMLITGGFTTRKKFLSQVSTALETGLKVVQLRILEFEKYDERLLFDVKFLCEQSKAKLILNSRHSTYYKEEVDGFHLTSGDLDRFKRRPVGYEYILGASCHTIDDLDKALEIDVDYVTISPVLATDSHPEIRALGWEKFAFLVDQAKVPVYALGGVSLKELNVIKQLGGHGIAAIRGFWF